MKLRIQDDSIRFRPTRSEVARLGDGLTVEAICRFPGGRALTYALTLADRTCVDPRDGDDRSDLFPNPKASNQKAPSPPRKRAS